MAARSYHVSYLITFRLLCCRIEQTYFMSYTHNTDSIFCPLYYYRVIVCICLRYSHHRSHHSVFSEKKKHLKTIENSCYKKNAPPMCHLDLYNVFFCFSAYCNFYVIFIANRTHKKQKQKKSSKQIHY